MRRIALNLAVAVLSMGVAVGAAEIVLQLADFPAGTFSPWVRDAATAYSYAPELETRMKRPGEYDVEFRTNSLGLRDDEIGPKKGARVLVLGDSFASGYGVERSQTFASLLENRLGVEIVNAGVGGYEIVHQVHYYRARGRLLSPDLVMYMLYLGNDLSRNGEWRETDDGGLQARDREYPVRTPREIKLVRLAEQLAYGRRIRGARLAGDWEPFPDYLAMCETPLSPEAERNYEIVERLLANLRDSVRASDARLLVAIFSYRTAVDPGARAAFEANHPTTAAQTDFVLPERRVIDILDRLDVDWLNLDPPLRAHFDEGGEPLYFAVDGHFNAAGNLFVADALEPALRDRLARLRRQAP